MNLFAPRAAAAAAREEALHPARDAQWVRERRRDVSERPLLYAPDAVRMLCVPFVKRKLGVMYYAGF